MILVAIIVGLVLGVFVGEAITERMFNKELDKVKFELMQALNYNEVNR